MKFFAAIVLLTVPLVFATDAVKASTPKEVARALKNEISGLYSSQMKISQKDYSNAVSVLFKEYGASRVERWDKLRNATIEDMAGKVAQVVDDALNIIGIDVHERCYADFLRILEKKGNESVLATLNDCTYWAREGVNKNLGKVHNIGYLEIYSRVQSTARYEYEICNGAADADPCYENVIRRLEMLKGRMVAGADEIRVMYAAELIGRLDSCESTFNLDLNEWKSETMTYVSNCIGYKIRNTVSKRNLGMDV